MDLCRKVVSPTFCFIRSGTLSVAEFDFVLFLRRGPVPFAYVLEAGGDKHYGSAFNRGVRLVSYGLMISGGYKVLAGNAGVFIRAYSLPDMILSISAKSRLMLRLTGSI